jgi:hypothetical protein
LEDADDESDKTRPPDGAANGNTGLGDPSGVVTEDTNNEDRGKAE